MTSEDQIIGSVYCTCTDHALSVETFQTRPDLAEIDVSFWTRGTQWKAGVPWRFRLRHAWAWLRGEPDAADAVILDREGTRQLIGLLREAIERAGGDVDE